MAPRPVMLVILDGWGWREDPADNAVLQARTPHFDRLWAACPHALLRTSGRDVGLPPGQMGNSEVGHMNIGAGRVVMQDLPRIDAAIQDGTLATAPALLDLVAKLRQSGGACHLMGLLSPGGVHSQQTHAIALARILDKLGVRVWLHAWTDGRDCPPLSSQGIVTEVQASLPAATRIATVCGRYYAMDRDNRWDRVSKAYHAMVLTQGQRFADAASAVDHAHAQDVTDEFVVPSVIGDYPGMRDGDGLLCFNFRADRVREILATMLDAEFSGFDRRPAPKLVGAVGMARYSDALAGRMGVLFPPQPMHDLLGEVVSRAGRSQLRMAETEKYPHVTYFLNGGREVAFDSEEREMVASPKVTTYDLQPEMSAPELTRKAVEAIRSGRQDLIVLNFANPDMVGHTGSLAAAIRAVETVDTGLGAIANALQEVGGAALVIADHGNCEMMRDPETGGPHTAHTTNPVPALLIGRPGAALHDGRLADVAPTLLALMGVAQPKSMTGHDLAA